MKNILTVIIDTESQPSVKIAKSDHPKNQTPQQHAQMVLLDMACLCEAVATLIHLAEDTNIQPSAQSLRDCIGLLTRGFADASYKTLDLSANPPPLNAHIPPLK